MATKKKTAEKTYSKELLLGFYTTMVRIREFEEHAAECFTKGMLAGNIHLSIGQEAAEAGAFATMQPQDYFTSTHRGHGHVIARGGDPKRAMAELFGKRTGYCKGKGGSMHIADMDKMNHLGANGIVGAGQCISAGSALASKIMGDDSVTVGCFGDGSTNEGTFHESLNMAAAWKLPMVWFIENNCYGVSTEIHRVTNTPDLATRAAAYDVPFAVVDGTDPIAVYEVMQEAMEHARSGKGPYVVEAKVYRYQGHYCGDPAVYRPGEYMETALANDGIEKLGKKLMEMGVAAEELEAIIVKNPIIKDCAMIPVKDALTGQAPKLLIALEKEDGSEYDAKEFKVFLQENLDANKQPKYIEIIDEIPRTFNGKIERNVLNSCAIFFNIYSVL